MSDRVRTEASQPSGWIALGAAAAVLLVFGGVIGFVTLEMRKGLRVEALQRQADSLRPWIQFYVDQEWRNLQSDGIDSEEWLLLSVVNASNIEGTLGLEVFDADGRSLIAVPEEIEQGRLPARERRSALLLESRAELLEFDEIGDLAGGAGAADESVLEILLPLAKPDSYGTLGALRLLVDGAELESDFAAMDRRLWRQSLLAYATGAGLIILVAAGYDRRLRRTNRALREKADRLASANSELEMMARTSAVGAVTAHLVHGLKNPLAGLAHHFAARREEIGEEERIEARSAARRMQRMIDEVVEVLRDSERPLAEGIDLGEARDSLVAELGPIADEAGVALSVSGEIYGEIEFRKASILRLILLNLGRNAIEAASDGGQTVIEFRVRGGELSIRILDNGSGLDPVRAKDPFTPRRSTKAAGAGIGLAISKQLARHIGAELELVSTSSEGTEFRLCLGDVGADLEAEESRSRAREATAIKGSGGD